MTQSFQVGSNHDRHLVLIDPSTFDVVDTGVEGWFPLANVRSRKVVFLKTPRGEPDELWHSTVQNLVDGPPPIRLHLGEGWQGPPLCWMSSFVFIIRARSHHNEFLMVSLEKQCVVGRFQLPEGTSPVGVHLTAGEPYILIHHSAKNEMKWVKVSDPTRVVSDYGNVSKGYGCMISDGDVMVVEGKTLHILHINGFLKRDIDLSFILHGEIDFWRPLSNLGNGFVSISSGLDTVIVNIENGFSHLLKGVIHHGAQEDTIDIVQSSEIVTERSGLIFPKWDENTSRKPILVLSGCLWDATGGNQRPTALARELSRLGHPIFFFCAGQVSTGMSDGVMILDLRLLEEFIDLMLEMKMDGTVILSFPTYIKYTKKLQAAGWKIIYDVLDNWGGFHKYGEIDRVVGDVMGDEELLLRDHEISVIASSRVLVDNIEASFPQFTQLILNGGPPEKLHRAIPPDDMLISRPIRCVYVGCIDGTWFDIDLIEQIGLSSDIGITIIGGTHPHPIEGVHFVGSKPYWEAMRYLRAADVGIIPFRHLEISSAVDPIKAYDYWAAGLWTVCTPEMECMKDRPYTIISDRGHFVQSIRIASEMRYADPPTCEFVRENSWAARARQLEPMCMRDEDHINMNPSRSMQNVIDMGELDIFIERPSSSSSFFSHPMGETVGGDWFGGPDGWIAGISDIYLGTGVRPRFHFTDPFSDGETLAMVREISSIGTVIIHTSLDFDIQHVCFNLKGQDVRFIIRPSTRMKCSDCESSVRMLLEGGMVIEKMIADDDVFIEECGSLFPTIPCSKIDDDVRCGQGSSLFIRRDGEILCCDECRLPSRYGNILKRST